jgi:Tol biopolymer transport system component
VRALDSLIARELPGTDGALAPFWAPDSHYLGFFAHEQLKTVSLVGEPPRTLCDLQPGNTNSATWSPDGVILFANRDAIWRISSTGGTPTPVTIVDSRRGETAHLLPQFFPDGRHFSYLARGAAGGSTNSWIVLGSLDESDHRPLIRASSQALYADPGYMLSLDNGALFAQPFDITRYQYTGAPLPVTEADQIGFNPATPRGMFAVSQTGLLAYRMSTVRELGWFDRSGKPLGWIGAAGRDSNPALSRDGRLVAVSRYDRTTSTRNLWIVDLEHSGIASPFTSHHLWANCPLWSPDGTRIVFGSRGAEGASHLYEKGLLGTADERALMQQTNGCPLDWSRDGQYLLYGTNAEFGSPESGLWVLPLAGKAVPWPLAGPWPRRVSAHISPNGRWIAYVSDSSGRNEIYVRSFAPGDVPLWRVSSRGGIDPQWRGDGRELFFIGADQQLMAVPVWTDGVFHADTPTSLFLTGLDPSGLGISGRNQYVVAADGTRFLLNQPRPDISPTPVTVVLNWPSALKR